jgi:hypothetical protein
MEVVTEGIVLFEITRTIDGFLTNPSGGVVDK